MDMKQLEAFVYVVETCSFSKAGELLHLTQPTISSHIASLERELKIKLIVRTTKETYPSDAGKLLYNYAREILAMRENAVQAIQVFSREMRGTITVAASTIPGQYYLPKLLQSFREKYPDIKFIVLDVSKGDLLEGGVALKGEAYDYNPDNWNLTDYVHMDNVYCAIYQEELSGYMAGYAAVKLGYTKLGFLGGMAVPAVMRFGYGYVQGVDAAAKELGITVDMKYAYGNQFFGDADITAVMDTWYADGTEVVFACGGGIYTSAAEAAKKVGGKVIGVDVDQKAIIDGAYGEGMTVTSAMKGLAPTTIDTLVDVVVNGNWANYAGNIVSLGLVSEDPAANYVQLSGTTQFGDAFTEADYAAMVKGMFDGSIKVSNDITAEPAVTNVNVEYLGNLK